MHKWVKDPETGEYIRDHVYKKKYTDPPRRRGPAPLPPRGPEWDEVRFKVYERDMYTCQDCGTTGEQIHAHHIDFRSDNNELDNLITLCRSCHFKRHATKNVERTV